MVGWINIDKAVHQKSSFSVAFLLKCKETWKLHHGEGDWIERSYSVYNYILAQIEDDLKEINEWNNNKINNICKCQS